MSGPELEAGGSPARFEPSTAGWQPEPVGCHLEVRLLGNPAVLVDGRPVEAFASPRLQRLLALPSLQPGRTIPRSRAAFRLWPDSTEPQAHTNLRKLIHDLRRALPGMDEHMDIDQQGLRWREGPCLSVDLVDFVRALEEGDDRVAAASYGGDLLPDCYDDWVIEERELLRTRAGDALDRLAAGAEDRGDAPAAIAHARARLALDPLWEPAYQRMMRAHARLGNRGEALRVYHRCAEILHAELGVEPDPSTVRMYEQIHGDPGPGSPRRRRPVIAPSAALVGRDSELAEVLSVWSETACGRAQLLVVTGEPGIGKTRLVDELARLVRSEATIGRSRAYEAAGRLPWGPVVDWLRTPEMRAWIGRVAAPWRKELELLLPELGEERSREERSREERSREERSREERSREELGYGAGADPGARRRLFDAIAEVLMAAPRPLLLLVDDLQWCDADTLELIGFLISSRPSSPVLVAGTARDEEVADSHPLARLTSGLGRSEALHLIELSSLDLDATVELARRLTGEQMPPDRADRFWRETAGNPLFVVEALRSASATDDPRPPSLTPTIRATIGARLERIPPAARPVADLAAVFGRQFSLEALVAAGGQDEAGTSYAIDELWRRRIVREQDGSYYFAHDKIREVVYDQLSPTRRRRLHSSVGDALIARHGRQPGSHSAELATHLEASGRTAEAAEAHQHAAEHAAALFALDEAIASARRGLSLLDRLAPGPGRDERELGLRLALGAAAVTRHGYDAPAAQESYERSAVLSRRLDRAVEPAALRGFGLASVVACRFDRSTRFGEELVAFDDDPVARTEGHYLLGVSSFWRGDLTAAEDHLRSALSSYRPSLGPVHLRYFAQDPKAVCLVRLALVRLWRGDPDAARDLAAEARRFAAGLEHPMTLGYVLTYSAMIACEVEDLEWFRRDVADGTGLADEGLGWVIEAEILFRAWLAFLEGRSGAIEALEAAVGGVTRLHLTHAFSLLARAHEAVGSYDRALAAVHDGLAWEEDHDQHYTTALLRRIEGDLLQSSGDAAGARAAFSSAVEVAGSQGALWLRDRAAARLERVLAER